ncbi:hypothetical protein CRUP_035904 [Coryphaenoides rupestris]|nr:hypothetical protein CRUP_035904 [Coryphaenoides rupestris]
MENQNLTGQRNEPVGRVEVVLPDLSQQNQDRPSVLRQGPVHTQRSMTQATACAHVPHQELRLQAISLALPPPYSSSPPGEERVSITALRMPDIMITPPSQPPGVPEGEHGLSEQSLTQCRVQQDTVLYLERQLASEKQRLRSMQLHISDTTSGSAACDWSYSLALYLSQPPVTGGFAAPPAVVTDVVDMAQHGCWPTGTVHLLPDCVPSIECYKHNNIRPPYTYAFLIRWTQHGHLEGTTLGRGCHRTPISDLQNDEHHWYEVALVHQQRALYCKLYSD